MLMERKNGARQYWRHYSASLLSFVNVLFNTVCWMMSISCTFQTMYIIKHGLKHAIKLEVTRKKIQNNREQSDRWGCRRGESGGFTRSYVRLFLGERKPIAGQEAYPGVREFKFLPQNTVCQFLVQLLH